ncbi:MULTISPECIES: tRNA glutamyl-Q(34) synthetase GluQRS [Acinetobacter]|uniref:Glutamyl-Q tRNA(Asp) synthetase n=2 Tax=Acinetobacter baylyi TaxID=202950 RepID=GLUQ_ACIAD|nr:MULTISPECIES: tRNA glutamyl-Q(34) synthetase GluQRS [Acinetobacter]Q6FFC0.1 RecName: Full=Glutamyl-Q tRNA(Asp) synthetase; Short=Glu-Q-RSs [Acinetobacter baylyi ADP1]ENV52894.1 glutamyl-Q tRNA(Asp) synthetase [Acinetobacter baylyi DSM 14961 = CIP 107474]KAF2369428.1 tRNA glutamyl-Q(34) synthetase GluQRS [Acinetobacter baylyi]KAF2373708.1 tRNA glutamyl-Q(34) synthetase GluQRS [Acinetobacter baylyi]KAF2376312.1 tRNA glutamyl-Q(34) synthetase GluQRS [Acinetobacter baylyi]KAF2379449.1 tRNA glu
MSHRHTAYVGRFAPSPTGPLHFGSLITAIASYCDAKVHQGKWLVRIEDTDIPRIYPGSEAHILACIDAFGFQPDGEILFQRDRLDLYENVLEQLKAQNLVYACQCTRKMLGSNAIYSGTCRNLNLPFQNQAIRVKVKDQLICFDDRLQGIQCSNLAHDLGDFVLKRRDGIINYQLAVVVDDYMQGMTHVVRGADLLDNTQRQIWLGDLLGYPRLHYLHLPLAMNAQGQKLSKQNMAAALDLSKASQYIQQSLAALHQPAVDLDTPDRMLKQAVAQWQLNHIPHQTRLAGTYL